jgi:hypothetical protein
MPSESHGTSDETGDAGDQNVAFGRRRRCHTQDKARRGDYAVVCAEHSGPEPSNSLDEMTFLVNVAHR